ncbi:MAG: hypothetical protein PVI71_00590 [Desulfobacterales bacterium]|jgi:hypothetical protein
MALQTLNLWELVLDGTQIFLCSFILLVLIRNKIKYKQLLLKAPSAKSSRNFNAEFMIQAIRQQCDLAFTHILETIDTERQTMDACFEPGKFRFAPHMLQLAPDRTVAQTPDAEMPEVNTEQTIYRDIEALAGQGMSLENISEELKVPKGEVELVLKLKRLSAESAKNKNNPPA